MDLFRFIPGYQTSIYNAGREPALIMLLAFILTFIIARGYTRMARNAGWRSASFGGVHTHHMVFGMVAALSASALMFCFTPPPGPMLLLLAAIFGMGAALVLDEFALIFHLEDVYWEHEGRKSIDAVILALALGGLFLLRATPFGTNAKDPGWLLVATIGINLLIVLIAALKGKIYTAIFGVFIPLLALAGAIRLAEPTSAWAHYFYQPKRTNKKMKRTISRYAAYEKRWTYRKEHLWDLIGGKTGRPHFHQDKRQPKSH